MSSLGGIGAYQQPWPPYTPPTFSQLDSNSNGGISLDEFEAAGPQGSSSSGDTTLSTAQQQRAQALFNKIDSNGDGSISSDELSAFQTQAQAFVTQLIANGQQPTDGGTAGTASNGTGGPPPSGSGHVHGGHHHHSASADSSTSTAGSTDTSDDSDSLLATLENIVDPTATSDDTDAPAAAGGDTPSSRFMSAINAYSNSSSGSDTWSTLTNLLQQAA